MDMTYSRAGKLTLDKNGAVVDSSGNPLLLEINPRMSGGLAMACMAGINFPLWAARLAMGSATPKDVPQPRTGFRVCMANRAVML
jgi:biotin carboxylase